MSKTCSVNSVLRHITFVNVIGHFISSTSKMSHSITFCIMQGFASGDSEEDAYSIRKFVADGHQVFLCQSYAKVTRIPPHWLWWFIYVLTHIVDCHLKYNCSLMRSTFSVFESLIQFLHSSHYWIKSLKLYGQNFGLYGERVGALSVVTGSREETERVTSQVIISLHSSMIRYIYFVTSLCLPKDRNWCLQIFFWVILNRSSVVRFSLCLSLFPR